MDLTVWTEKDKLYLRISGEVDHHAVKDARKEVDELIIKNRPKTLMMDLSSIDFMDSSGLGFVLGRLRKMNDINGGMIILNPAKRAEDMLKMAGADKLVKIVRSDNGTAGQNIGGTA